jgi:hypothetical protein
MMTDDLVRGVALEPLGAGVPVAHHAARVEHIDRIVRDRINQQLKTMIGREVLRAAQRQWAFSGLTILRFPGRHAVPPLSRRRTGQHMTPDLGITTEAEPMRTNANALPSNPATALAFVPSYNLGSGGDPEDEPRKPPRSDRGAAAREDLPYRVELWDEGKESVELVLAVTANGSIGYARLLCRHTGVSAALRHPPAQEPYRREVERAGALVSRI